MVGSRPVEAVEAVGVHIETRTPSTEAENAAVVDGNVAMDKTSGGEDAGEAPDAATQGRGCGAVAEPSGAKRPPRPPNHPSLTHVHTESSPPGVTPAAGEEAAEERRAASNSEPAAVSTDSVPATARLPQPGCHSPDSTTRIAKFGVSCWSHFVFNDFLINICIFQYF